MPSPTPRDEDKGIARSLGEFFGHIWKGVRSDPAKPLRRQRTETEERETRAGTIILRRTIIEEVQLPRDNQAP